MAQQIRQLLDQKYHCYSPTHLPKVTEVQLVAKEDDLSGVQDGGVLQDGGGCHEGGVVCDGVEHQQYLLGQESDCLKISG